MTEALYTKPLGATRAPLPVGVLVWRGLAAAIILALLIYLPFVLSKRAVFGVHLTNMQLLNIGLTQIDLMLIAMLGALSLNYLTGCAGLISIGHAAFYATGAMTAAIVGTQWGWPFPVALAAAAVAGAGAGVLAGLPSLRVRGLYFVLSTLAVHHVVLFLFLEYQLRFFDVAGVPFDNPTLGFVVIDSPIRWYFFLAPVVAVVYWALRNSLTSREGRAMRAMRDHELAATASGVDVRILRLKAFAFSSAIAAAAGALQAYFMSNISSEAFGLDFAIQFIAMIIIGGLGSLGGALVGAAIWLLLPSILSGFAPTGGGGGFLGTLLVDNKPQLVQGIFGLLVIVLLIFAPGGVAGLGRKLKALLAPGGGR
jgi:branched-chain amino acid transport system permease protein